MTQFKLSATLEGHHDDVKAIAAPFNDTVISTSRDATVLVWNKDNGLWNSRLNFSSNGFVNALTYDKETSSVISGGQDKLVNVTDLYSSSIDAKFVLVGHDSNVCSLDNNDGQIISGSWDSTAKVWEHHQLKYTLRGHNSSVWDVKIISKDRFLTASADRTVRLWDHDKEIQSYVGHQDVVRALALLPDGSGFASASNDGTVRITKFTGELVQVLNGHESFVYSVKFLSNGDIVTSGEDRTIRIWRDGAAIQVITVPSISVWSTAVFPNDDIVSGGSDRIIRIFTRDPSRIASEFELDEFQKEVEHIALSAQEFDQSKVSTAEVLKQPGQKEGQIVVVKSEVGINEAYSWSSGEWVKVGEVVSGPSNDKKVSYEGSKWDFVFDVDVKEGEPPLKLPYNLTENPYLAAQRFLDKNELPHSYVEEVVQFITANTQGVNIGQTTANPYYDSKPKVLPHLKYLSFQANNSDAILKGIEKINSTEKRISAEELAQIKEYVSSQNFNKLLDVGVDIISNWANKLPGFDILRLIVPQLDAPTSKLGDILRIGLDQSNPTIYFMTFRFLSNIFINAKWGEVIITDGSIASKIINQTELSENLTGKALDNVSNAISTLLLNYTIYAYKYKVQELSENLHKKLIAIGTQLSNSNSEAAYRVSVSFGNLIKFDVKFRDAKFKEFKDSVQLKYSEGRFKDIFEEIELI